MAWAGRTGTGSQQCPSCRARILIQLVGTVAALRVVADLTPLTPAQQRELREPNRLIWCLYRAGPYIRPRLRPIGPLHPADCPHAHVTEHRCPPTTLF
ncbi:hypothetical protein [Streptomyces sp. NPDC096153]|uniref:hypothetical protein n=1 Tax=Streptomyces sp. NPDC096153 TaxID=3155548 RepID=UPI00331DF638